MSDAAPKTLVEDRGSVRILTINNVKQRNALTMDVKAVFGPALAEAERDPNVRAIVVTGAGGTFSAGGDVTLFGDMTPAKGRHVVYRQREFPAHDDPGAKRRSSQPSKALLTALGSASPWRRIILWAAEDAKFCAAFNKIGLMPDGGLLYTLPQRVGMGRAKEMLMLASVTDGVEAKRLGMVDVLAPSGSALDAALAKAEKFAAAAPLAIGAIKGAFARWPFDLESVFAMEIDAQQALMGTADATGGQARLLRQAEASLQGGLNHERLQSRRYARERRVPSPSSPWMT